MSMSIFDALPSPADRLEAQLTKELELRRSRVNPAAWTGYHYKSGADFVLQHGRFWQGRVRPERYEHLRGPMSGCFENSREAAEAEPSLTYVEGYCTSGHGVAILHAWCIDDEGVVELTLPAGAAEANSVSAVSGMRFMPPDRWAYYGVPLNLEYVRAHAEHFERLGVLDWGKSEIPDRMRVGIDEEPLPEYPILKLPFDPNRRTLT